MTPRQANRGVDIFTLLVVASVGVALAGLTWRLMEAASLPTPDSSSPPSPPSVAPNIDAALALAPFGRINGDAAPPTSLALQLRGVVLAFPRAVSSALIAAPGAPAFSYGTGQSVPGGAMVEEIGLDHVLLRVNGRLERLELQHVSAASAAPAPPAAAVTPAGGGAPPAAPDGGGAAQPAQAFAPSDAPGMPVAAAMPSGLLESLGAIASPEGYRVGVEPSPDARRAGLEPGDVIERINGFPANAMTANRQLVAVAMASGAVQVDVRRNGRRFSFSFPLR